MLFLLFDVGYANLFHSRLCSFTATQATQIYSTIYFCNHTVYNECEQEHSKGGAFLKVFLAVFICKVLYFIGKRVGKGSSLPGKVALRLFPDVLGRLRLPDTIIAVTGSNGKTTTTELIVHVLMASGKSVGWNFEGSNQTEGIATLLLRISSFSGKVKRDAIVMECDERYARWIFKMVRPTVLLVTNLCRDQLTRNGHPEFVEDCLYEACKNIYPCTLVLNSDDPYVSALATGQGGKRTIWFGVSPDNITPPRMGMYDDGAFCPVCKGRMTYEYRIAGHYGSYNCTSCGLKRSEPDVEVTMLGTQGDGSLVFDGSLALKVKQPGITSAYNFCAAVAVAGAVGVSVSDSVKALDDYELKGGRVLSLPVGGSDSLLLLSKHENSFAYDCSLSWITSQKKPCIVIVLVDTISRKYYTSETSWLWDIDFDLLADENIKSIILAGRYVNELAARFAMSAVDQSKLSYVADLSGLYACVEKDSSGSIYAVTCFSDKAKLLKALSTK
jgi:UDP-N-acetylmuramyl tripeptide synthase